jgi:thiosulfate dehydrogenase
MKILIRVALLLLVVASAGTYLVTAALAQSDTPSGEDIVRGALLYDKWYAVLGVNPPAGNHPIWARQSTNTRAGPDTWRCSECHGWDYRGAQGAYASGSHYTGFPDVMSLSAAMSADEIVAHLKGTKDPAHDFSPYLDDTALNQLAVFLKSGTLDDSTYIDPVSLQVKGGDPAHGRTLYDQTCTSCHGPDGKAIVFRTEGVNEYLANVANRDPWRFLHRTRFGTAGTAMPVGYNLNWTPADGRDILAYVQTLPTSGEIPASGSPAPVSATPVPLPIGPNTDLLSGILTGLGAFAGGLGYALAFIGGFVLIGFLVVSILRQRK